MDMRRRTFLHGVVVSALAVNHARTWAQGTTPSLLGEGKPSRTAQATANLRAAHQLLEQPKIFGPGEIQERYFKGRPDGLRVNGLARLVKAGR